MSRISDLVFRYPHRALTVSKGAPSQFLASGGTVRSAVCADLTEAAGYWAGAIVRWDQGGNAGLYSSVGAFDAEADELIFDEDLPHAVAGGDRFTLLQGGRYASNVQVPGLKPSTQVNVTGVVIDHAAMLNRSGTGVLRFKNHGGAAQSFTWTPPDETEGPEVDASALAEDDVATLHGGGTTAAQRSKYITVRRTADPLPTADAQDNVLLESPTGSFLAAFTGADTEHGVTIYRPVAIENSAANKVYAVKAWCPGPWPDAAATSVASGGGIGIGDGVLVADDLTGWGAHGYVYNATRHDLRYYHDRSGHSVRIMDPGNGIRGSTAVSWEQGDALEPFPWFDIGLDAPGPANVFEDPADEHTAPAGVSFSCPRHASTGLLLGDLPAGGVYMIWERFFIPAGFLPLEAGRADLRISAEVTE